MRKCPYYWINCTNSSFGVRKKSLTLPTFKHQIDGSEIGTKGKLAILRYPNLVKVVLESFLDDAKNSTSIEFNQSLQY